MRIVIEKLVLYFILSAYYFSVTDEPSIVISLLAFILFFSVDIINSKYKVIIVILVFTASAIMFSGWVHYLPLLSFVAAGKYGRWSVLTLLLNVISLDFILTAVSGIAIYVVYLREHLYAYEYENRIIRDRLINDNRLLRQQHNELLHNHEREVHMAGLNERNRIARDMHDALGHSLSSSILLIESLQYVKDEEKLKQSLGQLQGRLKSGMDDIRTSIHHLYETSIDLKTRIGDYIEEMDQYSVKFRFDIDSDINHEMKMDILSIVREALNNIKKHSDARNIEIYVREQHAFITVSIKDNGTKRPAENRGMGLLSMKEIVEKYNGIFNTFYEEGFTVHVILYKKGGSQ